MGDNNGFRYDVRVAAFIEKEDPDHPGEIKVLTVAEETDRPCVKYALPGGKVEGLENIPELKERIEGFLKDNLKNLEYLLDSNPDKHIYETRDPNWMDSEELRGVLKRELNEEIGLSNDTRPSIKKIIPYSIIIEKVYSKTFVFHPIYEVKVDEPDKIRMRVNSLNRRERAEAIKGIRWATVLEMISEMSEGEEGIYYENSVRETGLKLRDKYFEKGSVKLPKIIIPDY